MPSSTPLVPNDIISLVNAYRTERGLGPLVYQGELSAAAQGHVNDMNANQYFRVANPTTGIDVPTRLVSSTPRVDFDDLRTFMLQAAFAGNTQTIWTNLITNPTFRAAIMNPKATHIGGYHHEKFVIVIGHNVVVGLPPPPPPPPPSSSGGGGGYYIVRVIYIRI